MGYVVEFDFSHIQAIYSLKQIAIHERKREKIYVIGCDDIDGRKIERLTKIAFIGIFLFFCRITLTMQITMNNHADNTIN